MSNAVRTYTLRFRGKAYPIERKVGIRLLWAFGIWALLAFAYMVYMLCLTSGMLSYHLGIPAFWCGLALLVVQTEVELDTRRIALLPKYLALLLRAGLTIATVQYLYAVENWSVGALAGLLAPLFLMLLLKASGWRVIKAEGDKPVK